MGPRFEMLLGELCVVFETLIRDRWYSGALLGWLSDIRFIKTLAFDLGSL